MAFLTVNHWAQTLEKHMGFYAILPETAAPPYRVVYLLHGLSDDYTRWMRQTSIERYAEERGLAVIMPDGARSFYTDMAAGPAYYSYVAEELYDYTHRMFPLSQRREDQFVAGLSMGGYGAYKLALRRPERYGAAASLSGALDLARRLSSAGESENSELQGVFADLRKVAGTSDDVFHLLQKDADLPVKPRLYAACGKQDHLYKDHLALCHYMKTAPYQFVAQEGEGAHNWAFWDAYIPRVLDFFVEANK